MQNTWSRVAQAHACYCRSCSRVTATLTNRPVPSARAPRRRDTTSTNAPRIQHMATTASSARATESPLKVRPLESNKKPDGKDVWASVARLIARPPGFRPPPRWDDGKSQAVIREGGSGGVYNALALITDNPLSVQRRQGRKETRKDYIDRLRKIYNIRTEWNWLRTRRDWIDKLEESVMTEDADAEVLRREPQTQLHMERFCATINDLVDQLLVEVYRDEDGNETAPDLLNSAWNQVRMLRSDGYPRYRASSFDEQAAAKARDALDQTNRNIMRDWALFRAHFAIMKRRGAVTPAQASNYKKKCEYFIGKICHNLLVVQYVPGVQNFNVLLAGFMKLQEFKLARLTIDSFYMMSHMRVTPMTIVTMLHFYRASRDIVGFYVFLRRITGQDCRGVGLRRRWVEDALDHKFITNWAKKTDLSMVNGFFVELPKLSRPVVEAVLDGLIDFGQPRQAAILLMAWLREGYDLDPEYLRRVVVLANVYLDRVAAMTILQGLFPRMEEFSALAATYLPTDFRQLVELLDIGESNTERLLVVPAKDSKWLRADSGAVDWQFHIAYLRRAVEIPLQLARLEHVQGWADEFGSFLASNPAVDLSNTAYYKNGLNSILRKHKQIQNSIRIFKRLARLDWIEEVCRMGEEKLQQYENQMLYILIDAVPEKHRHHHPFNTSVTLQDRLHLLGQIIKSLPWLRQGDESIHMARELEKSMKEILYDHLPEDHKADLNRLEKHGRPNFSFYDAVDEWKAYLAVLEKKWAGGDVLPTGVSAAALSTLAAPRRRPTATEETDMFTAAFLEKRIVPSA